MTPFLSKITGSFDGMFGIFFGKDGITIGNQAYDLGLTKKYKWAGDGAIASRAVPGGLGIRSRRERAAWRLDDDLRARPRPRRHHARADQPAEGAVAGRASRFARRRSDLSGDLSAAIECAPADPDPRSPIQLL